MSVSCQCNAVHVHSCLKSCWSLLHVPTLLKSAGSNSSAKVAHNFYFRFQLWLRQDTTLRPQKALLRERDRAEVSKVFWTPNMGCHVRVDLATGAPEHNNCNYLKSRSWMPRHTLRTVGDGGVVIYSQAASRFKADRTEELIDRTPMSGGN